MKTIHTLAAGGIACAIFAMAPAIAQNGSASMLDNLAKGRWAITSQDGGPNRAICLGNPQQLVQLRHTGSNCSRYVVENDANHVTVQYTCKARGYGRTSIRKETGSLLQIESQGIDAGLPFQFRAEARRLGPCR